MTRVRTIGCVPWLALILALAPGGCASLPSQPDTGGGDATTLLSSDSSPAILPAPSASKAETKPADAKPAEPTPVDPKPVEAKPVESPIVPVIPPQSVPKNPDKIDVRLRGTINIDADFVGQSAKDEAIVGTVSSGTGFRRARLGAEGTYGEQLSWIAEFDFAGGEIAFKDVYGQIGELPIFGRLRVGHMLEPFSLEGQTSSNTFAFVERSTIMPLDPARNWGGEQLSYTESERATLQTGVFRAGTSNSSGDDKSGQYDLAYDVRATWLPWYDADGQRLWHVGGAFSQRAPGNDLFVVNQGPQNSLLTTSDNPGLPFTPQITIPSNSQQLYNVQTALVLGPLSFQAEWTGTSVQQIGGGPVFLNGMYAFVSWFPTGEIRSYNTKDGAFGITKVLSPFMCMAPGKLMPTGTGAWELVARFDYINFNSPNIPMSNGLKVGDRETTVTIGANWYLSDNFRFMLNWIHAIPVDPNFGPSYADVVMLRTAIYW